MSPTASGSNAGTQTPSMQVVVPGQARLTVKDWSEPHTQTVLARQIAAPTWHRSSVESAHPAWAKAKMMRITTVGAVDLG